MKKIFKLEQNSPFLLYHMIIYVHDFFGFNHIINHKKLEPFSTIGKSEMLTFELQLELE